MTHQALHEATTQSANRRAYNVTDQFGRKWLVNIENKSGEMTGPPVSCGFSDPINTPLEYMRLDPRDPNKLVVDFEGWAVNLEHAYKDWKQRMDEFGYDRFGERYDPEEPPPPYALRQVGHRPLDPNVPRAAAAGDPAFLGVSPTETPDTEMERLRKENEMLRKMQRDPVAPSETPEDYEIIDDEE